MNRSEFWHMIDVARQASDGECERQAEVLTKLLKQREPEDIMAFERIFEELVDTAYTWDLWGAAYLINGGCSDDCFEYFRRWLVGCGEAAYAAALQNPESLVPLLDPEEAGTGGHECEQLGFAAPEAYAYRTGQEMPQHPALEAPVTGTAEPAGEPWEEDDLPRRFPMLAVACGYDE